MRTFKTQKLKKKSLKKKNNKQKTQADFPSKDNTQIAADQHIKVSFAVRETQIKSSMKYHHTAEWLTYNGASSLPRFKDILRSEISQIPDDSTSVRILESSVHRDGKQNERTRVRARGE